MKAIAWVILASISMAVSGCSAPPTNADTEVQAALNAIGVAELRRTPERAESLGLSAAALGGPLDNRLTDHSPAAVADGIVARLQALDRLRPLTRRPMTAAVRRSFDSATFLLELSANMAKHPYGHAELGAAGPYVVSHLDGAFVTTHLLLSSEHAVVDRKSAEAWLSRLRAYGDQVRADLRRMEADAGHGTSLPKAVAQATLVQALALRPASPRDNPLVRHFSEGLSNAKDVPSDEAARMIDEAAQVIQKDLIPALDATKAALSAATKAAADDPGVWRLPMGEAYYRDALRLYTTTEMSPDQIHELGLSIVKEVSAKIDATLAELDRREGTVGARLSAVATNSRYSYHNSEEERTKLFADIAAEQTWAATNLRLVTSLKPKADVRAILPALMPPESYRGGRLDGARPAGSSLRFGAVPDWPWFSMPTTVFNSMLPGRHLMAALTLERSEMPLLLRAHHLAAMEDGWALYAEDLADELGAYQKRPEARLGYLQSVLYQAALAVADTGIHAKRWTRQQATDYLTSSTGLPRAAMEADVDRSTVWPGRACAALVGRERIRAMSADADSQLGPRFDLREFNSIILTGGARPLEVAQRDVEAWVAQRKAAPR